MLKCNERAGVARFFSGGVQILFAGAMLLFATEGVRAQCATYTITQSNGSIVAGATDIGNHGDDVLTAIALPFNVSFYGGSYTTATASSNGNIQFGTPSGSYPAAWTNDCLPSPGQISGPTIFAHWDDLRTDGSGNGIFTSVSGSAPNRIFNIEWRTVYLNSSSQVANFEIRLYEGLNGFDVIYGTIQQGGASATIGTQSGSVGAFTQYSCNTASPPTGTILHFDCIPPVVPTGIGNAQPNSVGQGSNTLLTVIVTPAANPPSTGLGVTADLSTIGGSGSQVMFDDGTHGDGTAGDKVFSLQYLVPPATPIGSKTLPFTVSDAQGRSSNGTINLTVTPPCSGPDVTVFDLIDVANYGAVGAISAYAVGTNACNPGCLPVTWISGTNQHPVVAQNMYRMMNGRFEQIGQSWLKHTFTSTNSPGCGTCISPPNGGAQLGVNCTDAYGSGLNGSQSNLGPRSQVNATNGAYPYPFTAPPFTTNIDRRLQVFTSDVTPAQNPGALYFVECQYVTADDAAANNGLNNASYRQVSSTTLTTPNPSFAAATHWRSPAIQAWIDNDPTVTLVPAEYLAGGIVARFLIGAKATDNGNGTWHYEYAIHNLNSDLSGGSFSVPAATALTISNIGFHAPFSHSGEPFSNAPWTSARAGGVLTFATEPYGVNANANAIRWGTLYNFRFDANAAPVTRPVTIGLFKPGSPTSVTVGGVPVPGCLAAPGGDLNADSSSNGLDISRFETALLAGSTSADDLCAGDFDSSGQIGEGDIPGFVTALLGPA